MEQAFINALAARYANPQPEDRSGLDQAYAEAMCNVWHQHPESADAATLFAEAAMDLHPWDLWNNDQPQPWTPEILAALESAMKLDANHPGANHLYIHGMEASTHPEKASTSADRLRHLVPDSSHLEAEEVYRKDLAQYPGNGWSLLGLRNALFAQGKAHEAKEIALQLKKAWATADVQPTFTCYCQAE